MKSPTLFISSSWCVIALSTVCLSINCCSSGQYVERGHTFERSVENGLQIARSSAIPRYGSELFKYEKVMELGDKTSEELVLRGLMVPAIDEHGYIFVPEVDHPEAHIEVFNADGEFQYSIGRRGDEPGEFQRPEMLTVGYGIIDIYDPTSDRLTRYQTDGTLLDIVEIPDIVPPQLVRNCYRVRDNKFITITIMRPDHRSQRAFRQLSVTIFSSDWDTVATLFTERIRGGMLVRAGRISWFSPIPFGPIPQALYSESHGILLTTGKEPHLDFYDLTGNHQRRVLIDLPLQSVTEEDKEIYRAPTLERMKTAPEDIKEQIIADLEAMEFPEFKSYWGEVIHHSIQVDDKGFIWIRIPPWSDDHGGREEGIKYRVLSPEGEYLGITTHPVHMPGMTRVSRGHLLAVELDPETHIGSVAVYRISPAVPGLEYPGR